MAFIISNSSPQRLEDRVCKILSHYERSGFLYSAKRRRLRALEDRIADDLRDLLNEAAESYQVHVAHEDGECVVASVSGFRDGPDLFAIQHASSERRPDLLLRCLLSLTTGVTRTRVDAACMYFTPGNRWPEHLVRQFTAHHPATSVERERFWYYFTPGILSTRNLLPPSPRRWNERDYADLLDLVASSTGQIRAHALLPANLESYRVQLPAMAESPASFRAVEIFPAFRDGRLSAAALRITSPRLMNLSHLCSRLEIHLHAECPDRERVIVELAERGIAGSPARALSALLPTRLAPVRAHLPGFGLPVKNYDAFTWQSDGPAGFASTACALSAWYSRLTALPN